ncbi:predicted protein [Histoplasma mississippiense (nom. inval.)]|uniref:predicted protein n=1 Tax=Ajellomyces capsulatus (strain NAm1 / WU24) TaxID=2059318 RepID=UPI000157D2DD|nr:predicted protein [Histoplasma mississippiense (nom. inval.)]EDN04453.1 predicted protein [Histoplasma mississippiense (nom. inval.)]
MDQARTKFKITRMDLYEAQPQPPGCNQGYSQFWILFSQTEKFCEIFLVVDSHGNIHSRNMVITEDDDPARAIWIEELQQEWVDFEKLLVPEMAEDIVGAVDILPHPKSSTHTSYKYLLVMYKEMMLLGFGQVDSMG